jgi:diglucosylglycerate octanoyltransferase
VSGSEDTITGEQRPLRLVVVGDSTSFTDATGPQLPDHPPLYPNVAAALLRRELGRDVEVTVLARPGTTVRDALRLVTKDRHAQFDVIAHADALVVGVGSFDHAPGGVPPVVEAVVPYLRPTRLRRRARSALRTAYPWLVRATAGRGSRTPRAEFERLFPQLLDHLRGLTWGRAAGAVLGPTSHRSRYYGHRHPRHAEREALHLRLGATHGFATVATWPLVRPFADELNPDGIHWPDAAHRAVGAAVAAALAPQLRGDAPVVGLPAAAVAALAAGASGDAGDGVAPNRAPSDG